MTQKWDVIIIGGGLAGFTAANYLAKKDLSVLLLEKDNTVGGRAKTNRIKGKYFNLGPHALYNKGKAMSILEELDINLYGNSPSLAGILIENDIEYTAPFHFFSAMSTNLLNWKERIEWAAVLTKTTHLNTDLLAEHTFEQWVKEMTNSKKVQSLLFVLGRLVSYCHAPEQTSAKIIVANLKSALGGVRYIDGGWQTIIDQLHNKAVISGIQVQSNTVVKQLIPIEHEQILVNCSNGDEIYGKYVISTVGPQELVAMLGDKINPQQKSFLSSIKTVKGATFDISLTHLPNTKRLFAMDMEHPYYYSVHSNYAKLSDDGKGVVLHVFKYHHPDHPIEAIEVKHELEQFLNKLQPGWQQCVISSRFMPQITVNQRLPRIGDEQKLSRYNSATPGLYIAGDWASPEHILADGAVSSGKQAAEDIILNTRRKDLANYK
ncbi:FAD-dependent pyridine nucleotide-disulfide oxidoreductase [Bacillus sp. SA1-12]|nr:FAD-dependent pyridine nucleotide-disulfide oxidoreductase [Bacillus sp. SA1-12]